MPIFPPAGVPDNQLDGIQRELLKCCNQIRPPYFPLLSVERFASRNLIVLRAGKAVSRRYRNRRIGDFLKELDLTEGRSTGISKVLKVMKENGSPRPEFETDDDRSYFLIRLPVHENAAVVETPVETPVKTRVKTPDRILHVLSENPRMTLAEVAEVIGKSVSAVERASSRLVKTGHLKYIGPQKGGHWVVKEKP